MERITHNKEFINAIKDGNYYLALYYLNNEIITVRLLNALNLINGNFSSSTEFFIRQLIMKLNYNELTPEDIFEISNCDVLASYLKITNPDPFKVGEWLDHVKYNILPSRLNVWIKHNGIKGLSNKFLKQTIEKVPQLRDLIASYSPKLAQMVSNVNHREETSRNNNMFNRLFNEQET